MGNIKYIFKRLKESNKWALYKNVSITIMRVRKYSKSLFREAFMKYLFYSIFDGLIL